MALIDEFLYALGFQADLRGGQAFDEQLQRIGDHGESTRHSLLSTITAANLLSSALEKGAEMAKEVGGDFIRTAKEMEDAKITFESMYTTAAEGEEKFKWLLTFSRDNPVMGFEAAKETFMALKNNGIEPTAQALKALGDSMAALPEAGKYLPQGLSELIEGRYASGGVLSPLVNLHGAGKNRVYEGTYQNKEGKQVDVHLDFNDAQKATDQFMQILRDRFDGTMEKHARTMTGLMARWGQDWKNFQMEIMDNHVFADLEDELYDLITQWEAWAKSPDAHQMLYGISQILSVIVKIIGEAISITGKVIGKFTDWFGTANSIYVLLGSMFLASKWASIIGMVLKLAGAFKDVYAALQLVADGEKVVTVLGALMDGVLSPLSLIVVAIVAVGAGIAYMVKQWHDFRLGLLDSGPMYSFLQGLEHFFIRIRASIEYMFESLKIGLLEAQSHMAAIKLPGGKRLMNELTPEQQKDMAGLEVKHAAGVGAYVDKEIEDADEKQNQQDGFVRFAREEHKEHSDWNQSRIWAAYQQQQKQLKMTGDVSTMSGKRYSPHVALGRSPGVAGPSHVETKDDHSIHLHGPTNVYANNPTEFEAGLRNSYSGLASTQENFGTGGKIY